MDLVLGVDGGNTKTIALVARTDGTIVGAGRSGCSDIYGAASVDAAVESVSHAVTTALRVAASKPEELYASTFSMAGADWPEDFELLQNEMARCHFGKQIVVVNDALGALRAGSPDGTGVVVVCGTGVGTGARSPEGRVWHSSFWQLTQGSRDLGRKVLRAVYAAELGIAPATTLTPRLLAFFDQHQVEAILHMLTARVNRRTVELGKLAPILLDVAEKGDQVAREIVIEHGSELGDIAIAAARRVGIEGTRFNLVLAGSVLKSRHPLLADALVARVKTTSPDAEAVSACYEPVIGAVFLALESIGIRVDEPLLARLDATLPPKSLFET